jgi:hypothetical protein
MPSKNLPAVQDMKTGHNEPFCVMGKTVQFCVEIGHVDRPLLFDVLHSKHELRPTNGLYILTGHRVHTDAFICVENVPAGHAMHPLPPPGE